MTDNCGPPLQPTRASAVSMLHEFYLRVLDSGIPEGMVSGDAETLRRARIILSFTLVLILLGFVTATFCHWALPREAAVLIDTAFVVGLLLTLLIPLSFRRTGSLGMAAHLVLGGSFLVIVTVFSLLGGIRGPLLHWLGLLPMVAILMGARRSAWSWATLGFVTLALFIMADVAGWGFTNYLDFSEVEDLTLFVQRIVSNQALRRADGCRSVPFRQL